MSVADKLTKVELMRSHIATRIPAIKNKQELRVYLGDEDWCTLLSVHRDHWSALGITQVDPTMSSEEPYKIMGIPIVRVYKKNYFRVV